MKTLKKISLWLLLLPLLCCSPAWSQGITNNGGYIKSSSTSYTDFSGSGNVYLKSTTADRTTFGNMNADFTGSGQYKLIIPDDSYVTVDGNLSSGDSLHLQASANGMASLITNGTVTGNKYLVEQYLSQDQWHLVSSPVASAQSAVYTNIYLKSFYEPDSTWSWITATNVPLNVTEGYAAWASSALTGNATVEFRGTINTGNKSATVSYNVGSGKGDGWNLLGNPYPSALEWNSSWTKSSIDATVYVYDGSQYLTWNYNLGGYGTKTDGSIPSTQGFWVKANGSSPSLTIPNSERIHSSQSFYKSGGSLSDMLSLSVSGNGHSDMTLIGFMQDATDGFDSEYDAYKIFGAPEAPQLYSVIPGYDLAVNLMSGYNSDEPRSLQLGLLVGQSGSYTFQFTNMEDFLPGVTVHLEDRWNGGIGTQGPRIVDVRHTPTYTFQAGPADDPGRFILHFNRQAAPGEEPLDSPFADNASVYSYEKNVYVFLPGSEEADVYIFDMVGKKIMKKSIMGNQLNVIGLDTPAGYYIVEVTGPQTSVSEKVFIR